jgi:hypothetical protein
MMVRESHRGVAPRPDNVYFNIPGLALVSWDPVSTVVQTEWQGWANPTEFIAVLEAGLRALEEHPRSLGLVDCRDQKVVQQSDQDWVNRNWFPRALASGLMRLAVIVPKSELALTNIKHVLGRVPGTELDVAYFATVKEAGDWLAGPASSPPSRDSPTRGQPPDPPQQAERAPATNGMNRGATTSGGDEVQMQIPGVASVSWDQESETVLVEWRGWASSIEYVAVLEAGLRALKIHGGHRWIADGRSKRAIVQADQEWVDRDWFPRAFTAGLRRLAVVNAQSHVARMNSQDILGRVAFRELETASFDTLEEARRWISLPAGIP